MPEEHRLANKKLQLDDAKRASAENNSYTAVDTTELEEEIKVCSHFPFLATIYLILLH